MHSYDDLYAAMEAIMNDPEAAAAATQMMAANAELLDRFGHIFIYILAAALLLGLLTLIATWRIFRKAGTGGWKALIPIYCDYTLIKIAWKKKYFWVMVVLSLIAMALGTAAEFLPEYFQYLAIAQGVITLTLIVIAIRAEVRLAKAFGKGGGFAVGLIFLPFIFYPILGFGKAKFRRRKKRRKVQPAQA